MTRRGFSLIEAMASIALLVLSLNIATQVLHQLTTLTRTPDQPAQAIDLACDSLRRDGRRGFRIDGVNLLAGTHRWSTADRFLTRDGIQRCRIDRATWHIEHGTMIIEVVPPGQPIRELRLCQ